MCKDKDCFMCMAYRTTQTFKDGVRSAHFEHRQVLGRAQSLARLQRPHLAPEDRKAGNLHGGQILAAKGAEQARSSEAFEGRCDQAPRRAQRSEQLLHPHCAEKNDNGAKQSATSCPRTC
eukprot:10911963-Heterocapsa_arctica.AAC.1